MPDMKLTDDAINKLMLWSDSIPDYVKNPEVQWCAAGFFLWAYVCFVRRLRIDEMRQFLDEQTESITEYDEKLTRRLIEKITVYKDHFTIEFKSGTSMDIHR